MRRASLTTTFPLAGELLCAFLLASVGWVSWRVQTFAALEQQLADARYRRAQPAPPSEHLVFVAVDDYSIQQYGRWPWSRSLHAELIRKLSAAGARTIAFDVIFGLPSDDPEADRELAHALKEAGNVVLPVVLQQTSPQGAGANPVVAETHRVTRSTPELAAAAVAEGHLNLTPDDDGALRTFQPLLKDEVTGASYAAFGLAAAAAFAGHSLETAEVLPRKFNGHLVPPLSPDGALCLTLPCRDAGAQLSGVSYAGVLNDEYSPDHFRDKLVFVGAAALGTGEPFYHHPALGFSRLLPGSVIQANIAEQFLTGCHLRTVRTPLFGFVLLGLLTVCALVVIRLRHYDASLSLLCLVAFGSAWWGGTVYAFHRLGLVVEVLPPLVALAAVLVFQMLWRLKHAAETARERREQLLALRDLGQPSGDAPADYHAAALRAALLVTNAEVGCVWIPEEDDSPAALRATHGLAAEEIDVDRLAAQAVVPTDGKPLPPVYLPPAGRRRLDAAPSPLPARFASVLLRPLIAHGRCVAVLCLGKRRQPFEPDEIAVLDTLAHQSALTLENARLMAQLRSAVDRALEMMPFAVLVVSQTGKVQRLNAAARRLLLLEDVEQPAADLDCSQHLCTCEQAQCPRFGSPKLLQNVQHHLRRSDGVRVPVLKTAIPINLIGEPAWLEAFVDLTETKARETELRLAKTEAEAASRAKSQFLANMSHEIRTPLNAVIGMADLLRGTDLTDEQREYVEVCHGAGESLLSLINDILDLSKIEAGSVDLESVVFSPADLLDEVVSLMAFAAQEKGLTLTQQTHTGIPELVVGDPTRLRQVLVNLVSNAVKFTAAGSVTVEAQLSETSPSKGNRAELQFSVTDTGVGIPPERLEVIFDDFVQVDQSTTRQYGGTGLGLAICRRLAALMGGSVSADSELDQGSTFRLTVPLQVETWLPEPKVAEAPSAPSVAPVLRPARVLVAEDNPDNRLLVAAYLKKTPLEVDFAENGREAVEKALASRYDLILMDLEMPEMDGYEATRRVRQFERDQGLEPVPLLALTAHATEDSAAACAEAGCTGYLTKPIKKASFLEALARHLSVE